MQADLRFQKTELALQQSLLNQLQSQPLAKISVKDLCEQAQVSRNAFYQHYESKQHLYDSILTDLLIAIEQACHPVVTDLNELTDVENRAFLNQILTAVDNHRHVITQLLASQPAGFSYAFHEMLVNANLKAGKKVKHTPDVAFIHTFVGGIVAFVNYWLSETDWELATAQNKLFASLGFYHPKNRPEINSGRF